MTQRSKDTWVLAGELDMATRPILDRSMDLATLAGRVLVLDVSELTFVDSTGIHALVRILDAVGPGCLVLRGTRPNVRNVVEVVGLTMFRNLIIAS